MVYNEERDRADRDTTSRLRYLKEYARIITTNDYPASPYLAAGVISARECVRAALEFLGSKKVQANRDSGVGMWIQEIGNYLRTPISALLRYHVLPAWRDFYTHVLAAFPRLSMGRPFQEKYAGVQWESNPEHLDAWRSGRTGVPIVDAAIRQGNTMGVLSEIIHFSEV